MWYFILAVAVIMYFAGRIDEDNPNNQGGWFWMPVILLMIFGISAGFDHPNHFVTGKNKPRFFKQETVMLPDSTYGKVNEIYYSVEGVIYKQEVLKAE